eukprot:123845_1
MMESYCKMNMECIDLFGAIESVFDLKPSHVCYGIVLKACTQATAFHIGVEIHNKLRIDEENGWMLRDALIPINLIDFYAKCGSLVSSQAMFDELKASARASGEDGCLCL